MDMGNSWLFRHGNWEGGKIKRVLHKSWKYIVACQRGGVSNEPPWQPGILWSVHRWTRPTGEPPRQKNSKGTNRTLDSPFFLLRQGEPGTSQYSCLHQPNYLRVTSLIHTLPMPIYPRPFYTMLSQASCFFLYRYPLLLLQQRTMDETNLGRQNISKLQSAAEQFTNKCPQLSAFYHSQCKRTEDALDLPETPKHISCQYCGSLYNPGNYKVQVKPKMKLNKKIRKLLLKENDGYHLKFTQMITIIFFQ